jgi:hypothetical protein
VHTSPSFSDNKAFISPMTLSIVFIVRRYIVYEVPSFDCSRRTSPFLDHPSKLGMVMNKGSSSFATSTVVSKHSSISSKRILSRSTTSTKLINWVRNRFHRPKGSKPTLYCLACDRTRGKLAKRELAISNGDIFGSYCADQLGPQGSATIGYRRNQSYSGA